MINIYEVKEITATVGGFSNTEVEKYLSVVENAIRSVEKMLRNDNDCADKRIEFLAAVRAGRDISLITGRESAVTSFKVGDISINEDCAQSEALSRLYEAALENCRDLLCDDGSGFAFLDV